ncbi:MAG: transposase [Bacteroidales bacterium]|nr:transposase [Bacteroidales bacterium]
MINIGVQVKHTDSGYERLYTLYQASNCQGCPMRGACNLT